MLTSFLAILSRRIIGELIYSLHRSFIDIGPSHSDSLFSNFFSSITARQIEAKFHAEPPWDRGTKLCSNGLGHMTKMAAIPVFWRKKNMSSLKPKGR